MDTHSKLSAGYNPFLIHERNLLAHSFLEDSEFRFLKKLDEKEKAILASERSIMNWDKTIKARLGSGAKITVRVAQAGVTILLGSQSIFATWLSSKAVNTAAKRTLKYINQHLNRRTVDKIEKICRARMARLEDKVSEINVKIVKKAAERKNIIDEIAHLKSTLKTYKQRNCWSRCRLMLTNIVRPNYIRRLKGRCDYFLQLAECNVRYLQALDDCQRTFQHLLLTRTNEISLKKTVPKEEKGFFSSLSDLFKTNERPRDCWGI